jgi:uncharacterized membrane protein
MIFKKYSNKVFEIFNVSISLAIFLSSLMENGSRMTHVHFFGTNFLKLPHIHVLILQMTLFSFFKKKK